MLELPSTSGCEDEEGKAGLSASLPSPLISCFAVVGVPVAAEMAALRSDSRLIQGLRVVSHVVVPTRPRNLSAFGHSLATPQQLALTGNRMQPPGEDLAVLG